MNTNTKLNTAHWSHSCCSCWGEKSLR